MVVLVAALGYFVDIFDLYLFGAVRVQSLKDLGVDQSLIMELGMKLLNAQMFGLLLGGLSWGILGDKRGRVSVLYGSIFLYSIANFLNGFVNDIDTYTFLRFIAGFGLAGELGAAITLVSEVLPQKSRGYGATIVAGVGLSGSIAAALMAEHFHWRNCYIIGGLMGLTLLGLRLKIGDSEIFKKTKTNETNRGSLKLLFSKTERLYRYIRLIFIGMPIWFVGGLLVTFAPEFSQALGISGDVSAPKAIYYTYIGVAIGDFVCGVLSQYFHNRRHVIISFLTLEAILVYFYLTAFGGSVTYFYTICFSLGFATGYWAVLMMTTAEHFGTNLRSTVTTSVPNFIRGSVTIMLLALKTLKPNFGILPATAIIGSVCLVLALVSLWKCEETYSKNLDFQEV